MSAGTTGSDDRLARMARLTPEQRALLTRRLHGGGAPSCGQVVAAPVPRRAGTARHPLTVDQERIWLIHRLDPTNPAYHVFAGLRLRGDLAVDALRHALAAVVARQGALRTTFHLDPDADPSRPVAVVHERMPVPVPVVNLRDLPAADRESEARRRADASIREPFDLAAGPMLRITLYQLADREHLLVSTVHHIVWDRGSFAVFFHELAAFSTAARTGGDPNLPGLPIQYADYAEWQPAWLREEALPRHVPYWRDRLSGAPAALTLPTDRPRPPVQTFHGARYPFRLPSALSGAVRQLARREGVTVTVVFLAAWYLLLHRYSGQTDLVVGITASTRNRPGTEHLVGYFLTILPLRTEVRPEQPFRDLLRTVRAALVGAFDHGDLPFGTLLDELDIDRDPSRNPVYQASFIMVDFNDGPIDLGGVAAEPVILDSRTAKDEVSLGVFDDSAVADHFFGLIEYNVDLFTEATVAGMWRHLERILVAGTVDPGRAVRDIDLVDPAERRRMLVDWNPPGAGADGAPAGGLPELVARWAAARPDAVAVRCGADHLTYARLLDRAGRLAGYLRQQGVTAETVVGVCLERTADLVVSLLGILIAGGAYLPLDARQPAQRLAALTAGAGAALVLTETHLRGRLTGCLGELLSLGAARGAIEAAESVTAATVPGDRLAYVIHTSGSTGRPNAVAVSHHNLAGLLQAMAGELRLDDRDTWLAVTPTSFDIAGLELFAPLVTGGQVLVVPGADAVDGRRLADLLSTVDRPVLQATPATWQLLLDSGWHPAERRLRAVVGGETLPPALAQSLSAASGGGWNAYGPTETTIWSTVRRLEPADGTDGPVPIGRPLITTACYVLDERLRPVPVAQAGELYLGGDGVARGYHAAPAATAGRFVADHLGPRPGRRLYRTGDLVRWRADGTLVFLGRADGQVKLRGHRIEPAEIEAQLGQHPGVRRAAVVLHEHRPGDRRLVAYVQPTTGAGGPLDADVLRTHLRARLPEAMVPATVVLLDALPLSPNGKVDRRALPAPPDVPAGGYVAPRGPGGGGCCPDLGTSAGPRPGRRP